jgi:hypothetical protein
MGCLFAVLPAVWANDGSLRLHTPDRSLNNFENAASDW